MKNERPNAIILISKEETDFLIIQLYKKFRRRVQHRQRAATFIMCPPNKRIKRKPKYNIPRKHSPAARGTRTNNTVYVSLDAAAAAALLCFYGINKPRGTILEAKQFEWGQNCYLGKIIKSTSAVSTTCVSRFYLHTRDSLGRAFTFLFLYVRYTCIYVYRRRKCTWRRLYERK